MIDRQFLVSPDRVPTLGTVTRATDSSFNCEVAFRGRSYECKSAGKNALAVGDSVSFVQIEQIPWVIKSDALYPTRFKRPLTDWAGHHKYNLLLQYLISKGARKNYTFQFGTAQSVVSTNVLSVSCWDGRTRDLPVEYAGSAKPAADFSSGDQVLLYQKTDHNWVVVGKSMTIETLSMTIHHDFPYSGRTYAINGGTVGRTSTTITAPFTSLNFYMRCVNPYLYPPVTNGIYPTPALMSLYLTNITGTIGKKIVMQAYDAGFNFTAPISPIGSPVEHILGPSAGSLFLEKTLTFNSSYYPPQLFYHGFITISYVSI